VPLAHATGGHWLIDFGIYFGPLFAILAVVVVSERRRRRREAEEGEASPVEAGPGEP
jgi:hypothetical protein